MEFLTALFTAFLCVAGAILILIFVGSFVVIASSMDKIASAFTKWIERR
jgi:hypothetical protein